MIPPDDSSWQPATFTERGVAVPFTSPMLAGARVRSANRRYDIVVPHPAGARGVYILALSSIAEFCSPTLHDTRLLERLADLRPLSPSTIRVAARAVAAEGVAGRAAAAAAVSAEARDQQAEQGFAMRLLMSLMHGGDAVNATPEQRAAQAVLKLAGRTGRDADAVHFDIKRLATLVIACGIGGVPASRQEARHGRCRMLLDLVGTTASAMLRWADLIGASRPACTHFAEAAGAVRAAGGHVLAQAQALVDDPAHLLDAWAAAPEAVAESLGRPGWLLDGWEGLCLTWQLAETDDQRMQAATEACILMPPMPPETESWFGAAIIDLSIFRRRHAAVSRVAAASDAVSTVARNERSRALAA